MKKIMIVVHALFMGVAAAVAVWCSGRIVVPVWAVFLGWVCYFLFVTTMRSAVLTYLQSIVGVALGAALVYFNGLLSPSFGVAALMVLAFAFAFAFVYVESLSHLNNIPVYYLGAIAMMASGLRPDMRGVGVLAIAIAAGFGFGWIVVLGRSQITRLVAGPKDGGLGARATRMAPK